MTVAEIGEIAVTDLRRAETVIQNHIIEQGRRLFANGLEVEKFEIAILGEALNFRERTACLEREILQATRTP